MKQSFYIYIRIQVDFMFVCHSNALKKRQKSAIVPVVVNVESTFRMQRDNEVLLRSS